MPYVTTPSNYDEIIPYVQEYGGEAQEKIIIASRVFVIDTCSFQMYMKANRVESFADYLLCEGGCLVVFRTILMELSGDRGRLDSTQINFFRSLRSRGIDIFVLFEENIADLLQVYTESKRINAFLRNAIGCLNSPTSCLRKLLESHSDIEHDLFGDITQSPSSLYGKFWDTFRKQKEHNDSLGEYACIICIHILANMEDSSTYKYIFLTEDKPALSVLSNAICNARKYNNNELIGAATLPKVVQWMYYFGILKLREDVISILEPNNSFIKVMAVDTYSTDMISKKFSIEELADYIVMNKGRIVA